MTNDDEVLESDKFALEDKSGEAEIEAALKEIDKLQNSASSSQSSEAEEEESKDDIDEENEDEVEEGHEEGHEEEFEPKDSNPKKPDKMWKVKRRLYKTKSELRAAEEENVRLRDMLSQAEVAGTYQYGRNVYTELDRAKELVQKAADIGDTKAFIEATVSLNNAQYKVHELEKLASQAMPANSTYQNQAFNEGYDNELFNEAAKEFLDSHKELQPNSKFYNKSLAESVIKFANNLDDQIKEAGREDIYFTEHILDYFDAIKHHISDCKIKEKKRKSLESASHVGGVRNSYSGSQNGQSINSKKVILTPEEKELCKISGIAEKEWAKYKLIDENR